MEKDIKDTILDEYKKGNIVVSTIDGLCVMPLEQLINQHTEGILYDLNINESSILSTTSDEYNRWVNDYALAQVIRSLKNKIKELENN